MGARDPTRLVGRLRGAGRSTHGRLLLLCSGSHTAALLLCPRWAPGMGLFAHSDVPRVCVQTEGFSKPRPERALHPDPEQSPQASSALPCGPSSRPAARDPVCPGPRAAPVPELPRPGLSRVGACVWMLSSASSLRRPCCFLPREDAGSRTGVTTQVPAQDRAGLAGIGPGEERVQDSGQTAGSFLPQPQPVCPTVTQA